MRENCIKKERNFTTRESMAAHFVAIKGCRTGICRGGVLLGFLPYKGRGIEQICTEAVKWYRKATEQGNKNAPKALEKMKKR